MADENKSTAVAVPGQQGLSTPAATGLPTPAAAPAVTADQTDIARIAATPPAKAAEPSTDPKALRSELATRDKELATAKSERDGLATRLAEMQLVVDKVNSLGGIQYVEKAVGNTNLYGDIGMMQKVNGQLTQKHYNTVQTFVDTLAELFPQSAEYAHEVMNNHYGAIAWDNFTKWLFKVEKPSNELVEAARWGIDYYRTNGRLPNINDIAKLADNQLPEYCYDDAGNEIPQAAASWRASQARLNALQDEIAQFKKEQQTKSETQLKAERDAKTRASQEKVAQYQKDLFDPVEKAIQKNVPDYATNPRTEFLRIALIESAKKKLGPLYDAAIKDVEVGNDPRAASRLSGMQAIVLVAVADALPMYLPGVEAGATGATQEQVDKAKSADGANVPAVDVNQIPYRPDRKDFDNDQAWLKALQEHANKYRMQFKTREEYLKTTTRSSAA